MDKKVKKMYDENGNITHKVCSKCGESKSINEFHVNKSTSDGHESKCKECKKKYDKERKKRTKELGIKKMVFCPKNMEEK